MLTITCQKCGSEGIYIVYREKGETWVFQAGTQLVRETQYVSIGRTLGKAKQECLVCCCRRCQYQWEVPPLKPEETGENR